jgi:outer membrane receptor for ferrienterochelin and colicins
MKKISILSIIVVISNFTFAQYGKITGILTSEDQSIENVKISIKEINKTFFSDSLGYFSVENLQKGIYTLRLQQEGFENLIVKIELQENEIKNIFIPIKKSILNIDEVVVTGTLKEVSRMDCTVPVEIFTPTFFKKNPTPTIFDALQNINGVRPQLNCNICNTGDIHINGLEGPYTMVLIDGMPIVSSLSTVYGLSGIPNSMVERIEIVKGPASSLFGSEAIGGIINIITKKAEKSPLLSLDIFTTSYLETNADIGLSSKIGKKATVLTGINYFNYSNKVDNNNDNFTDVTLQDRISVFQKLNFNRKNKKIFTLAGRFF